MVYCHILGIQQYHQLLILLPHNRFLMMESWLEASLWIWPHCSCLCQFIISTKTPVIQTFVASSYGWSCKWSPFVMYHFEASATASNISPEISVKFLNLLKTFSSCAIIQFNPVSINSYVQLSTEKRAATTQENLC